MCGFIAQLVEHRTGIAEVTGSNPVEALIFFFQASPFQLLKLENLLRWSFFTFNYLLCSREKTRHELRPPSTSSIHQNKKRTTQGRKKGQKRQVSWKKGKKCQESRGIQPLLYRLAYFLSWIMVSLVIRDQSIQGRVRPGWFIVYSGIPISWTFSFFNLPIQ